MSKVRDLVHSYPSYRSSADTITVEGFLDLSCIYTLCRATYDQINCILKMQTQTVIKHVYKTDKMYKYQKLKKNILQKKK